MKVLALALFLLAALSLFADAIESQEPDELWLARCFIGESRNVEADYIPIAKLLDRRYHRAKKRYHLLTFGQQIRGYCKSLNGLHPWILKLPVIPPKWEPYRSSWDRAVYVAHNFRKLKDPCPTAMHFGSPRLEVDLANAKKHKMIKVDCGATANNFYRLGE